MQSFDYLNNLWEVKWFRANIFFPHIFIPKKNHRISRCERSVQADTMRVCFFDFYFNLFIYSVFGNRKVDRNFRVLLFHQ